MPAWNEAEGIGVFIRELNESLLLWTPRFVVVDDCSTDGTAQVVRELATRGIDICVISNAENRGHGPSTLRALRLGQESGSQVIVAVDGDGQFRGADVADVVQVLLLGGVDIVEGVRRDREDPAFRRIVSAATRFLVWTRVRRWPADANTPLRAYTRKVLGNFLERVPADAVTPNLLFSAMSRVDGLTVIEVPVTSLPRRGVSEVGNTWGTRRKSLPSRKFLAFCSKAALEWTRTPVRAQRGSHARELSARGPSDAS